MLPFLTLLTASILALDARAAEPISAAPLVTPTLETVEPVFVEAPKVEIPPPAQPMIQVSGGVGAKVLDAPVNELGVEIKTMERQEDISQERRADTWWLTPTGTKDHWTSQIHGDLSADQKMKARILGPVLGQELRIEAGAYQDHRSIPYMNNGQTPYDASDDAIDHFANRRDGGYGKVELQGASWETLADIDGRFEDVHAGPLLTGRKIQQQGSLNGKWKLGSFDVMPFFQARNMRFSSDINPRLSNETQGSRTGFQTESKITPSLLVQTNFSRETMSRDYTNSLSTNYGRYYGKTLGQWSWLTHPWIEVTLHGFGEVARDQIDQPQSVFGTPFQPIETTFLWDAGIDVSSSHRFAWGMGGKFRRYALMPTPTQRFGDGGLLDSAPTLPPETGYRASIGPWWSTSSAELALSAFSENATNAPIMVAISPTAARTMPLGGVKTLGLELSGNLKFGRFTISPNYTLQSALNDSQINWQNGKAVPGRPNVILRTEANFKHQGAKAGITHRYQNESAMDLGGLWVRPAQNQFDLFTGYGRKNWELRLVAVNLIQNLNLPERSDFQGTAAPNLLEPSIQQREIRIQCEITM